jgi:hypothetical protein
MMIRPLLVFWLIVYSLRYRTRPWNFFQLNSSYFNPQKNIFSKLELNQHIPQQWRLSQQLDDGRVIPSFPLFIKPEWGQNSHGVALARNSQQLAEHRAQRGKASVDYLLQQAAVEKREFEFFYIREADNIEEFAVASLTETINSSGDCLAVNGIFNPQTRYHDLSQLISEKELHAFWEMVKPMGFFSGRPDWSKSGLSGATPGRGFSCY